MWVPPVNFLPHPVIRISCSPAREGARLYVRALRAEPNQPGQTSFRPVAGKVKNAVIAPERKRSAKSQRKRNQNAKMIVELVENARTYGLEDPYLVKGMSVIEALECVLDRAVQMFLVAQQQADKLTEDEFWVPLLDAQGNRLVEPNKWIQFEKAAREEVFEFAARMQSLKIDERRAHIEEVQQETLTKALIAAAIAAGLNEAQQKTLGQQLRLQLQELQSSVLNNDPNTGEYTRRLQADRVLPPPPYLADIDGSSETSPPNDTET